jgi:uncharacterized phage-associated protein
MSRDVRAIANFVLDLAQERRVGVSNLSINKIVYFLHANYLVQFGRPLVTAKIEAWEYGPVFRELYREFKAFGDKAIEGRAFRISPESGLRELCVCNFDRDEVEFLRENTETYLGMSLGKLLDLAHLKGGPWDQVWNHDKEVNASMSISNEIIKTWHAKAARH